MTATTLRASYSISAPLLQRFNAVVPPGERSRMIKPFWRANKSWKASLPLS